MTENTRIIIDRAINITYLLGLLVIFTLKALGYSMQLYLMFFIVVFSLPAYYITTNHILKYWRILLFISPPAILVAKVASSKFLNSHYNIEIEYLNNSIVIASAAVLLWIFLLILLSYAVIFAVIKGGFIFYNTKTEDLKDKNLGTFWHVFVLSVALFAYTYKAKEYINETTPYFILADSYSYSDCSSGKKKNMTYYIRKDNYSCYEITTTDASLFKSLLNFEATPKMVTISSKKL